MDGINNEFDFVTAFNNKKVKELNPLLHKIVTDIYFDISEDDLIKTWRNHKKQKTGLYI